MYEKFNNPLYTFDNLNAFFKEIYIYHYGESKYNDIIRKVNNSEKVEKFSHNSISAKTNPNALEYYKLAHSISSFWMAKSDTLTLASIQILSRWDEYKLLIPENLFNLSNRISERTFIDILLNGYDFKYGFKAVDNALGYIRKFSTSNDTYQKLMNFCIPILIGSPGKIKKHGQIELIILFISFIEIKFKSLNYNGGNLINELKNELKSHFNELKEYDREINFDTLDDAFVNRNKFYLENIPSEFLSLPKEIDRSIQKHIYEVLFITPLKKKDIEKLAIHEITDFDKLFILSNVVNNYLVYHINNLLGLKNDDSRSNDIYTRDDDYSDNNNDGEIFYDED